MATIGNSTPLLYVEGSATQISGSGTKRTVKITAKFKVNGSSSSSWYGYPCNWRARVHNSYGSYATMKGTESWNASQGLRTFEQTLEVDVGTTGSTNITVGIYTNHPTYDYWNGSYTWTFTVGSTNVAPVLSGSIATNVSGTIAENTSSIELTSPAATDGNNNLSGYRFAVSVNGGGYTEIYKGSSRTYTHTISGGEGTTYKYSCYAYDASGATSATIYSGTLTKNTLTGAALASSTSIAYNTTKIAFTWGNPSNTNGSTAFDFDITSSDITVYRASTTTDTARAMDIAIVSSAPSSGAYILKSDIINKFKGLSYKGTLNFTLATKNAYGTTKTSTKAISVNLQSTPGTPGSCAISTSSTARRQVADTKNYYYIPDDTRTMTINWGSITGAVGEAITYDLEVAYNGGSYGLLLNTSSTSYEHKVGKQTASRQISYRVRAKASYGTYGDYRTAQAETLHYYNSPGITVGTITRGATTADVIVTVKTNSSIPNINTVGTWQRFATGTTTPVQQSGTLTVAQTAQTVSTTGLTDEGLYDLKIVYNDGTGFSSNQSTVVKIGANSPIFFVNKYGAGVGGVKANANYALVVNGGMDIVKDINISGNLDILGTTNLMTTNIDGDLNVVNKITGNGDLAISGTSTLNNLKVNGSALNSLGMSIDFLNNPTILANATDLNTVKNPGRYTATSNANAATMVNSPTASAFTMDVKRIGGNFVQQELTTYTGNFKYTRAFYDWDGTWGAWLQSKSQSIIDGVATNLSTTTAIIDARLPVSGMYLATFEYNQNPGGSTTYWASYAAIVCVGVGWNGSALVDRITFSTLAQGGGVASLAGTDFNWRATGGKDKALNSISDLRFTFTKNAAHNMADIIRKYSLVRLADL